MRVTWVHPSWRDLVIDDLAGDAAHRRAFLAAAELPGVLLALSHAGGASGERRLPLLAADEDWDALGDAVHRLCAELGEDDLIVLLGALESALDHASERERGELLAVAEMAVGTTRRQVDTWGVELLERWFALARHLPERPDGPDVRRTWEAQAPASVDVSDAASIRRLESWLSLTGLLADELPGLLVSAGFPDSHRGLLLDFERQVQASAVVLRPEVEHALWLVARLVPDRGAAIYELVGTTPRAAQDVFPPAAFLGGRPADARRVRRILLDL